MSSPFNLLKWKYPGLRYAMVTSGIEGDASQLSQVVLADNVYAYVGVQYIG